MSTREGEPLPMTGHESQGAPEDPRPIFRLIAQVRRVLRQSWVVTGIALTVGVLAGAVALLGLADVAFPFGRALRFVALALVVVPTLYTLLAGVLRPFLRRLTEVQVARRIEKHLPHIHNRLVSCIDLSSRDTGQRHSVAFYHRLVGEALDRVSDFRPGTVVDGRSLRRAAVIAAAGLLALALMVGLLPRPFTTAVTRILAPLSDIPPASDVRFRVSPGDAQALVGDPVTFTATVEHGEPDDLRVHVTSLVDGQSRWHAMQERDPGVWSLTLTGLEQSVRYRVHGGGTWSRLFHVAILERPRLEAIQTVVHYPAYLGLGEPRANPPQVLEVAGPEGAEVEVLASVGGDASEGEIQLLRPREAPESDPGEGDPFDVVAAQPMRPAEDGRWSGRFRLEGAGLYRVEMRNALGHANKTMKEARYLAIVDGPPQVTVEQPGRDTTVSKPVRVPVVAAVYDDFALAAVGLVVQPRGEGEPQTLPVKEYGPPPRSDTALTSVDLAALELHEGDHVVCWMTATDRAGQTGRSGDFTVRIAAGDDAADVRFAEFDQTQDAFQERLLELMVETGGLHREFEKINAAYAPLAGDVDVAPGGDSSAGEPELRDPETEKKLEALRQDLARFAGQMAETVQLAEEVGEQMDASLEQMGELALLPAPLAQAMMALDVAYQNRALLPLAELARLVEEAAGQEEDAGEADADAPLAEPDLDVMLELSGNVQDELDALQAQMRALADARAGMWEDLDGAVAELEGHVVDQQAEMTQREIAELQEFLDAMQGDFDDLKAEQEQLAAALEEAGPDGRVDLEARQQELERVARSKLDTTRQLLDTEELVRQLRRGRVPVFPDAPYAPNVEEYFVPPSEDDPEEPKSDADAPAASDDGGGEEKEEKKREEDEEPPLYLPALGGPRARLDPRFARRPRPAAPLPDAGAGTPAPEEDDLRSRQQRLLQELDVADRTLGVDHETLRNMIGQLNQARAEGTSRHPSRQVGQVLRSPSLRQALAMSNRMRRLQGAPVVAPAPQADGPAARSSGRAVYYNAPAWGGLRRPAASAAMPPAARTVILRMQPQQREELLQGMREQAPEGYQPFVQAYFRKLARVRQPD